MRPATFRDPKPAHDAGGGFACDDCGAALRLVGYGGDRGDRAIFACMRRGCDCRVQIPAIVSRPGGDALPRSDGSMRLESSTAREVSDAWATAGWVPRTG